MLPVAVILVLHMFAYPGVGVIADPTGERRRPAVADLQLSDRRPRCWSGRCSHGIGAIGPLIACSGAVGALLAGSVLVWHGFPAAYVPGQGFTEFYIVSEYIAAAVLAVAALLLYRVRDIMDTMVARVTLIATGYFALTDIVLTLDASGLSTPNQFGHLSNWRGSSCSRSGSSEPRSNGRWTPSSPSSRRARRGSHAEPQLAMVSDCHGRSRAPTTATRSSNRYAASPWMSAAIVSRGWASRSATTPARYGRRPDGARPRLHLVDPPHVERRRHGRGTDGYRHPDGSSSVGAGHGLRPVVRAVA